MCGYACKWEDSFLNFDRDNSLIASKFSCTKCVLQTRPRFITSFIISSETLAPICQKAATRYPLESIVTDTQDFTKAVETYAQTCSRSSLTICKVCHSLGGISFTKWHDQTCLYEILSICSTSLTAKLGFKKPASHSMLDEICTHQITICMVWPRRLCLMQGQSCKKLGTIS